MPSMSPKYRIITYGLEDISPELFSELVSGIERITDYRQFAEKLVHHNNSIRTMLNKPTTTADAVVSQFKYFTTKGIIVVRHEKNNNNTAAWLPEEIYGDRDEGATERSAVGAGTPVCCCMIVRYSPIFSEMKFFQINPNEDKQVSIKAYLEMMHMLARASETQQIFYTQESDDTAPWESLFTNRISEQPSTSRIGITLTLRHTLKDKLIERCRNIAEELRATNRLPQQTQQTTVSSAGLQQTGSRVNSSANDATGIADKEMATVKLVKARFKGKGLWRASPSDQNHALQSFMRAFNAIWGTSTRLVFDTSSESSRINYALTGGGTYDSTTNTITLYKFSLMTLLHELKHSLQHQLPFYTAFEDKEVDAQAWSHGIFKYAMPNTYRRASESGAFYHSGVPSFPFLMSYTETRTPAPSAPSVPQGESQDDEEIPDITPVPASRRRRSEGAG